MPVEAQPVGGDRAWRRQQPQDRAADGRLARAALADDAELLAPDG